MNQNNNPFPDADGALLAPEKNQYPEWSPLVRFRCAGGDLFSILIINFVLSLVTLGIYSFWGKTRRRAYLWQSTEVLGEPLEYTGTGKELFISFIIVVPLFILLLVLGMALQELHIIIGSLIFYGLLIYLWQFASYRALRYRLTRTRWRGIRGNLEGSAASYAWKASLYILLMLASCFLLMPYTTSRMISLKMNNMYFGNRRVVFFGTAEGLYKSLLAFFLGFVLLITFSIGLLTHSNVGYMLANPYTMHGDATIFIELITSFAIFIIAYIILAAFFEAAVQRWFFGNLTFGSLKAKSTIRGYGLMAVHLTNLVLILFTLGIGLAWALVRRYRVVLNPLQYSGDPDLPSLLQDTRQAPSHGEGLLEALDLDIAF